MLHWRQVFRLDEIAMDARPRHPERSTFSGYLSMAYEAAVRLVHDPQTLRLVELHDNEIIRIMNPQEDSPALEVLFSVHCACDQSDHRINHC